MLTSLKKCVAAFFFFAAVGCPKAQPASTASSSAPAENLTVLTAEVIALPEKLRSPDEWGQANIRGGQFTDGAAPVTVTVDGQSLPVSVEPDGGLSVILRARPAAGTKLLIVQHGREYEVVLGDLNEVSREDNR